MAYYFPVRHVDPGAQLPLDTFLRGMQAIIANPRATKVLHNAKFDRHMFRRERVDGERVDVTGPFRDTFVEGALYDENSLLGLKDRAARLLKDLGPSTSEKILATIIARRAKETGLGIKDYLDRFGYSHVPVPIAGYYACFDVDATFRLSEFYDENAVATRVPRALETEIKLIDVLLDMEETGIPFDADYARHLGQVTGSFAEGLAAKMRQALGLPSFSPGSDAELRQVLVSGFGAQLTKKTPKFRDFDSGTGDLNEYSVDSEVLLSLAPTIPFCADVLKWREAEKLHSTYSVKLLRFVGDDGCVHGDFKALGTKTGRLASEKPNMQNFASDDNERALVFSGKSLEDGGSDPWSVKRLFVRRGDDIRVHLDYSQIELRVLAEETGDPILLDVYQKGEDVHTRTSLEVFGTAEKAMRRLAKVINFGLVYGMSAVGFSRQTGTPQDQAEQFMAKFFERYSGIPAFQKEFLAEVRQRRGYFENRFGRPRRVPMLFAASGRERGQAERQTMASLIQGTAAELTKASLIRIWDWEQKNRAGVKLISTIHDEISADMPRNDHVAVTRELKRMMEDFRDQFPRVPIVAEAEYSDESWADKRKLKGV